MNQLQERPVTVLTLPLPSDMTILRPEQVVLDFPKRGTLDIGSLCYLKRETEGPSRRRDEGRRVDLGSLDKNRVNHVRTIIEHINNQIEYGSLSPTTANNEARLGILYFIDWADGVGHYEACYSEDSARVAFQGYVENLWERTRVGEISVTTAARFCTYTLGFLTAVLGVDDIHRGLNLPKRQNTDTKPTIPPGEVTQARATSLCTSLFEGLSDLVMNNAPFPHRIYLPKYLGWPNDTLWVFPLPEWFRTPDEIASDTTGGERYRAYNFSEGRMVDVSEIIANYADRRVALNCIYRAKKNLNRANESQRSGQRISAAMQACNAFIILFLANTGMNLAQAIDLEWSDKYRVSTVRQKFKVIKWRAKGKNVSFEIQSTFFADFKKFLELRDFLLDGRECPYLFFSLGVGRKEQPKQMRPFSPRYMYQRLQKIDPSLPVITPRQWRAANIDWMLRKDVPVSVAADVAQNSEALIKSTYASGSPETQKEEFTVFLDTVSAVVLSEGSEPSGAKDSPLGLCVNYGEPKPRSADNGVIPDCRNPEGCLFCDEYKVHADKRDTRKLVSCRYCIRHLEPLASSVEQYESVFGLILSRINQLLEEISQRSKEKNLVNEIVVSVEENGELDEYWAAKLELLAQLGLVS